MYENFYKLNENKQKQILDGAMLEFSRYGYKKASVAQIANSAGISKSMIFYYFGTKEKLYNLLVIKTCDYALKKTEEFVMEINDLDYIESYYMASKFKLKLFEEENAMMRFSGSILLFQEELELSQEAREKLNELINMRENYGKIMHRERENTKLRKDIPKEEILKYIKWIMDGFARDIILKVQMENFADVNFDEDWGNFNKLVKNLEEIFYRGENEDE